MAKRKIKSDPHAEREASKYENPIPSREFILQHLSDSGQPSTYEQLLDDFGLTTEDELEALRRRLIAMVRDGQLLRNRKGAYGPIADMEVIAGRVIGHKDGFGFLVPDDGGEDLFLGPRQMRMVFHGDRALARVSNVDSRGRREGLIVQVLEHNTQQIVGRFFEESGACFVQSANQRINQDILIDPDKTQGAQHGQIVVVAITTQPGKHARPLGEVLEILGDHMAPGMEINVAIRNHSLPFIFPDSVLAEAQRYAPFVSEEESAERQDFRKLPFVTIDGEDAKDFDDAVYCERRKVGGWKLYVAIADVSHYVSNNTELDREALARGNSVYFPGRVIPMLPEVLSNNLCSLNPKVDRLVMVCEMTIQPDGRISAYKFHEGVIHSHARLTYTQVHAMMEKNDKRMKERFESVVGELEVLYELFHVLHEARAKRGAIDFDLPETKIVFGKDRKIEKIVPYERFLSHRVIEECMLAANICVAKFLDKNKQPGLYRVHEGPTEEKLKDLRKFLTELGLAMPGHRDPIPGDYAHILRVIQDRPDAHLIQTVLLRSMSQAIYSPDNRGHFGLAYDAYAHFTSPIRRYPDLMVHRAIRHLLRHKKPQDDASAFHRAGEHCSMTERRADDATREVSDWLKCEFMLDKVGQEFEGVVSGVTNFGIFVELKDIYVEGLIHISALPGDYYQFDAVKHALIGGRTGRRFQMGDSVKILVARVDLDQGKMDFVLAEGARSLDAPPRSKKRDEGKSSKRRRKPKHAGSEKRSAPAKGKRRGEQAAPDQKKKRKRRR